MMMLLSHMFSHVLTVWLYVAIMFVMYNFLSRAMYYVVGISLYHNIYSWGWLLISLEMFVVGFYGCDMRLISFFFSRISNLVFLPSHLIILMAALSLTTSFFFKAQHSEKFVVPEKIRQSVGCLVKSHGRFENVALNIFYSTRILLHVSLITLGNIPTLSLLRSYNVADMPWPPHLRTAQDQITIGEVHQVSQLAVRIFAVN